MNADGTGLMQVPLGSMTHLSDPTWLTNSRLVFASSDHSVHEIYAVDTDGGGLTRLTNDSKFDHTPAASPDGTKIAFVRATSSTASPQNLIVINADGTNRTQIRNDVGVYLSIGWSPDGTRICYAQTLGDGSKRAVAINAANGSGLRVIHNRAFIDLSWGPRYEFLTPIGSNVNINAGGASVTFGGIGVAGTTTFTPLSPSTAGTLPAGFVRGTKAYEISTTAAFTSPVTFCLKVPTTTATTLAAFNLLSLMQNEAGVLVDRTTIRNFATRTICSTTTTLSPFSLAEQRSTNPAALKSTSLSFMGGANLPSVSVLVVDSNGNPMSDVVVHLTGTEARDTDTDAFGVFNFINLTQNGNYNVQAKQIGYIFNEYSQDLVNLTGENTIVFTGTQSDFSISGRVTNNFGNGVSSISLNLIGSTTGFAETDTNGGITFTNLPADGFYTISPIGSGQFTPATIDVSPLTNSQTGIDFLDLTPAVEVSVSGRVTTPAGQGLRNAIVTITDGQGVPRSVLTSSFGFYSFDNVLTGQTYVIRVSSNRFRFASRIFQVNDTLTDVDFVGLE